MTLLPSLALAATLATSPAPSLEDVLAVALEAAAPVQGAQRDLSAAEQDRSAAVGGFDPVWRTRGVLSPTGAYPNGRVETTITQPTPWWGASAFAGYRLGTGTFAVYDEKAKTLSAGEVRLGVNVPLWRDGPIDARRAALTTSELNLELAKAAVAAQRVELARSTANRYWQWVEAAHALQASKSLLELAETRDGALAERVARGDVASVERLENQRAIAARRGAIVSQERALQVATLELNALLSGTPVSFTAELAPPELVEPALPEVDVEQVRELATTRRPELHRLETQRALLSVELALAENLARPVIDLQAAASKDFGVGSESLSPLEFELGLVVDVPVLARTARGRTAATRARLERLGQQVVFARGRVEADVRDAASAVETAHARVRLARVEAGLARELAAAERSAFELGNSTLLLVNLREQAATDAALKEISALADAQRALVTLDSATARWAPP